MRVFRKGKKETVKKGKMRDSSHKSNADFLGGRPLVTYIVFLQIEFPYKHRRNNHGHFMEFIWWLDEQ